MIAVVAAVRGEIESDREAFLARGEIAAVEGVGIFGGGEAGILPDRPGLCCVHRGVGAAKVRRLAWIGVEEVEAGEIAFRRRPVLQRCLLASPKRRPRRCLKARPYRRNRPLRNWGPDSFEAKNTMYRLQRRKRVATHINKVLHARLPPALLILTRSAGEMHDRAGCSECFGSARRLTSVHLVGRT